MKNLFKVQIAVVLIVFIILFLFAGALLYQGYFSSNFSINEYLFYLIFMFVGIIIGSFWKWGDIPDYMKWPRWRQLSGSQFYKKYFLTLFMAMIVAVIMTISLIFLT